MNRLSIAALLVWTSFATLTYQVAVHGPITALDAVAMTWSYAHRAGMLTLAAHWVSETGGPSITSVYAAILIVIFLMRRQVVTALTVAFTVYGAVALNVAVKHALQRSRPAMDDPLVHLITYSYPSGHAAAAMVFGGLAIVLLQRSCEARIAAISSAAVVLWIVAVCGSRIYLGAHYPTDVAGGILEGTGWLLLCSLATRRWQIPLVWHSGLR